VKRTAAGEQLDADDGADDSPGNGPGDEQPGQRVREAALVAESQ
jgi:hypothetical protein